MAKTRRPSVSIWNAISRVLHSVLLMIQILIFLLLLVSAYAYKIKPEQALLTPFLCFTFPFFALANLVMGVVWLFRLRIWALLSMLGFVLTFDAHQAWFPMGLGTEPVVESDASSKELHLLTYNIMYLDYPRENESDPLHPSLAYIRDTDADVVCLQEAGSIFLNQTLKLPEVRSAFKKYPYVRSGSYEGRYSVVCLSKYPILRFWRVEYPSLSNSSFVYDIKMGEDTIRLINNHLESNKLDPAVKKKATDVLFNRTSDDLTGVAEAMGNKVGNATAIRANQAIKIAAVIADSPHPVVVCGDFNDIPGSFTYRTIREGLKDAWIERGRGWGNTFHDNFFLFRIDYILSDPRLEVLSVQRDKQRYSDHYPLQAKLRLP